jgi:hypothetical protein
VLNRYKKIPGFTDEDRKSHQPQGRKIQQLPSQMALLLTRQSGCFAGRPRSRLFLPDSPSNSPPPLAADGALSLFTSTIRARGRSGRAWSHPCARDNKTIARSEIRLQR